MSRLARLRVGALNIKLLNPNDRDYVSLFSGLAEFKRPVVIRGTRCGLFGKPQPILKKDTPIALRGFFYHFTEIDPRKPWFNVEEIRQLKEGESLPIPENWKPNSREVMYFFDVEAHLFFFDLDAINHLWALDFLKKATSEKKIADKFGIVEITIVSSMEPIDKILRMPKITKLTISISPPNGDDSNSIIKEMRERLETHNATEYIEEWKGSAKKEAKGVVPDEITKAHMQLATTDGKVIAIGRNFSIRAGISWQDRSIG
jgi:hypothetical protein